LANLNLVMLLWLRERRKKRRRNRWWVHPIIARRRTFGTFHHLVGEMRLEDHDWFKKYFRTTVEQFDDLLSIIGPHITFQDTNYRKCIPSTQRLAITLRWVNITVKFRV
jgi:hypothetical protein